MLYVDCLDAKTVHTTEGGDAHRQLLIAAFRATLQEMRLRTRLGRGEREKK